MKFAALAIASVLALASVSAQDQPLEYPEYLAKSGIEAMLTSDIKPLILGGTEVPVGQRTWTVGLRSSASGRNFCGGTLISPKHVLTAAHCGSIAYVSVGSHFLSGTSDGEQIPVTRTIRHPSYSASTNSYDFAILELSRNSRFAPAKLASAAPATGSTAIVAGWGTTSSGGTQSNVLLQVSVPVVAQTTCATRLRIDSTMLCAGGQTNRDSCQGDSGGPLMTTGNALIGVVSWGNGCGLANYPGVYARVSVAKSWIDSNTGNLASWV
jgi:trypsin